MLETEDELDIFLGESCDVTPHSKRAARYIRISVIHVFNRHCKIHNHSKL
jgi:hypothetical protein